MYKNNSPIGDFSRFLENLARKIRATESKAWEKETEFTKVNINRGLIVALESEMVRFKEYLNRRASVSDLTNSCKSS